MYKHTNKQTKHTDEQICIFFSSVYYGTVL